MTTNKYEQEEIKVNDKRGSPSEPTPIIEVKKGPIPEPKKVNREPEVEESYSGEITISNFVMSLASSALMQMGLIPDPETNQKQKNLELAKQQINIIEMLKLKTKNNLTKDEEELFTQALYELHLRFVEASKKP